MQLHYQAAGHEGYEAVISSGAGLHYLHEFGVLCLSAGGRYEGNTGACEALLHLIEGTCDVATANERFPALGGRATPFAGRPTAVYLPPATTYTVTARSERVEILVSLATCDAAGPAEVIGPERVVPRQVGQGNWQRTVTVIAPPEYRARRLILGETLNPPGNWSGVPAHKHDTLCPGAESMHEELYYFRVDRPGGWGVERVYDSQGLDELLLVQDRVVTVMPRGYHTVAAAPGFTLYYAFVLSGPDKALLPALDPAQAWLAD